MNDTMQHSDVVIVDHPLDPVESESLGRLVRTGQVRVRLAPGASDAVIDSVLAVLGAPAAGSEGPGTP